MAAYDDQIILIAADFQTAVDANDVDGVAAAIRSMASMVSGGDVDEEMLTKIATALAQGA